MRCLRQHWVAPLFFLPFAVLLAVHHWLGLSDAMLAAPSPGERHWPLYNVAMFLAFATAVNAYAVHTAWLACRSWTLAALKLAALATGWTTLLFWGS